MAVITRGVGRRRAGEIELHCLGGFVVTALYGLARPTADVDVLAIAPLSEAEHLTDVASKGSALHRKHGLYLDLVTVVTVPGDHDRKPVKMFPGAFERLRLFSLNPYDIALSKLGRNIQRDRDDVKHLARTVPLDPGVLRERYEKEPEALPRDPQQRGSDAPTLAGADRGGFEKGGWLSWKRHRP